jgi:putative SOS response-associated peptidase YedK
MRKTARVRRRHLTRPQDIAIAPGCRELTMARWGMPSPVFALKGKTSDPGTTNVRNVQSPHESRCVPFAGFSENEALPDGTRDPAPWRGLTLVRVQTPPLAIERFFNNSNRSCSADCSL